MAGAVRVPITGVWERSPQRVRGAEPLVSGPGKKPPEAENLLAFGRPMEAANLPNSPFFCKLLNIPQLLYNTPASSSDNPLIAHIVIVT